MRSCCSFSFVSDSYWVLLPSSAQDKISLLPVDPSCYQLLLNRKMEEKVTPPGSSATSEMPKREEEEDEGVALDMEEDISSSKTTLPPGRFNIIFIKFMEVQEKLSHVDCSA